jgi:hypothetical protein
MILIAGAALASVDTDEQSGAMKPAGDLSASPFARS